MLVSKPFIWQGLQLHNIFTSKYEVLFILCRMYRWFWKRNKIKMRCVSKIHLLLEKFSPLIWEFYLPMISLSDKQIHIRSKMLWGLCRYHIQMYLEYICSACHRTNISGSGHELVVSMECRPKLRLSVSCL